MQEKTDSFPAQGVIYVAPREDLLEEARISVRSLKRTHPELHVTLYTDLIEAEAGFDRIEVPPLCRTGYMDKVVAMPGSPYEKTLFLDTDTFITGSLQPVFDLLESYPVVVARSTGPVTVPMPDIPTSFAEFNTGVIGYRRSPETEELFALWKSEYEALEKKGVQRLTDQPGFRNALWKLGLKFYMLGTEFNCRTPFTGFLNAPVVVIHGRDRSLSTTLLKRLGRVRSEEARIRCAEAFFERTAQRLNRSPERSRVHWLTPAREVAVHIGGLKTRLYARLKK